jgi:hypothetical protein
MPFLLFAGSLLLFAAVMGLMLLALRWDAQSKLKAWEQLSLRTGLTLDRGGWWAAQANLSGRYRSYPLVLKTYTVGTSSRSRTIYTLVAVGVQNKEGSAFRLSPAGVLSRLGEALGMQDVKIGDEAFDRRFAITSRPPEFVMALLGDDMLRHSLMDRVKRNAVIGLEGNRLTYTCMGVEKDVDYLEFLFNLLCDIADRIDGSAEEEEEF